MRHILQLEDSLLFNIICKRIVCSFAAFVEIGLACARADINKHRQHIDYAQRYYSGMSKAAVESGISLQFCMSVPHHILASITLDGVTHARGSFDNHGSVEQNMAPLAYSSLFFDAVGLRPSKDNVQTLRNTRGGLHLNPQLEAVIATLSTGPCVSHPHNPTHPPTVACGKSIPSPGICD